VTASLCIVHKLVAFWAFWQFVAVPDLSRDLNIDNRPGNEQPTSITYLSLFRDLPALYDRRLTHLLMCRGLRRM
jgi:hypothetical protein